MAEAVPENYLTGSSDAFQRIEFRNSHPGEHPDYQGFYKNEITINGQ